MTTATRAFAGLLILAIAFAAPATAQISLGIRGGVNLASIGDIRVNSLTETLKNRTGFHVGAFADVGLGLISVRPGLTYVNAGSLFEGSSYLVQDQFRLNYLAVPIDLKIGLPVVYGLVGPEFSYLLSSGAPADFEDDLKSTVMNAGIGVGVQFGPILGELRYTFGLSGLTEKQFAVGGVDVTTGDGQKANSIRFSVGFKF
ncbi:MAG TPA: porin family protein [Gemmatimonadales bacterium]